MKSWISSLDNREKKFVIFGSIFSSVFLIYTFLWSPFVRKYEEIELNISTLERTISELQPIIIMSKNGQLNESSKNFNVQQSPIIIIDQTLRERGLERYRKRSQPSGDNSIRVEFENVSFDELIIWLGDLSNQYAMKVENGSFSVGSKTSLGRINASITLERSL
tara:strand:- start:3605 stop:4096 length:492 start_codon:yes stop_codon:yes gene_type:complete